MLVFHVNVTGIAYFLLLRYGFAFDASHVYGVIRIALQFHLYITVTATLKRKSPLIICIVQTGIRNNLRSMLHSREQKDALEIAEK